METPIDTFAENTVNFFDNVRMNLDNISNEAFGNVEDQKRFENWVNHTFMLLRDFMHMDFVMRIVEETIAADGTANKKDAFDLLNQELNFYNTRYVADPYVGSSESFEAGSIAVNSVKDLINKLPNWLKKVLTIISEALGIAKTVLGSPII